MTPAASLGESGSPSSPVASGGLRCRALRIRQTHRVVLALPQDSRPAQVLELMMGLRLASSLRAPLWLIDPGEGATSRFCEMAAEGVPMKLITGWRAKLLEWLVLPPGRGIMTVYGTWLDFAVRRGRRKSSAASDKKLKAAKGPSEAANVYVSPYYKRLWLDSAPRLAIPADRRKELQSALGQLGVEERTRLVALDVRDSASGPEGQGRLESYRPAVIWLQEEGFTLVRVGGSDGPPLDWPGVVDVTVAPGASEMLRLHCIARAEFLMTDMPEISAYGWAFGTPVLTVNAVDCVGSFPVQERDMITVRRVCRRADGRVLPLRELFSEEFVGGFVEGNGEYQLVDNTPEEVLAAVQDMVGAVEGRVSPETPEQREFRFLATRAGIVQSTRPEAQAGYGPHHCYLGRGRLAPSFARAGLGS